MVRQTGTASSSGTLSEDDLLEREYDEEKFEEIHDLCEYAREFMGVS